MTERYIHYSKLPLGVIQSRQQMPYFGVKGEQRLLGKPNGIWFSVENGRGDGWLDWCISEEFGLNRLKHATEFILYPDAKILRVRTEAGIDAFHQKYATTSPYPGASWDEPDWELLAKKYQGILIAPYIHSRRLDPRMMWYYGWDCASGVIWDATAIKELKVLEAVE